MTGTALATQPTITLGSYVSADGTPVRAVQWTGSNLDAIERLTDAAWTYHRPIGLRLRDQVTRTLLTVQTGQVVIAHPDGHLTTERADHFHRSHTTAPPPPTAA